MKMIFTSPKGKQIVFDDYVDNTREYDSYYTEICTKCHNKYKGILTKCTIDDGGIACGTCGVEGCDNEANYYVDFDANDKKLNFKEEITMDINQKNFIIDHEIIWTNGLVSMGWYDTRLDLLDSDGFQIDYILDCSVYEDEEETEIIQSVKNVLDGCDEAKTCEIVKEMFDNIGKKIPLNKHITINDLRNQYGEEWVCRIGNIAIIIKE